VREAAVAAAAGDDQRRKSESTSPGSGKRRTSCFENTSSPSAITSNCPFRPSAIVAS
jgi:hypothetical protein